VAAVWARFSERKTQGVKHEIDTPLESPLDASSRRIGRASGLCVVRGMGRGIVWGRHKCRFGEHLCYEEAGVTHIIASGAVRVAAGELGREICDPDQHHR